MIDPNIVFNVQTPTQIAAGTQQAQNQRLQGQAAQQQIQAGQLQYQEMQRQIADDDAFKQKYAQAVAAGKPLSDDDAITTLGPTHGTAYLEARGKVSKANADLQKQKDEHSTAEADYAGGWASYIKQNGYSPQAIQTAVTAAHHDGYDQQAQQIAYIAQSNPQALPGIVDGLIARSPAQNKLASEAATAAAKQTEATTGQDRFGYEKQQKTVQDARVRLSEAKSQGEYADLLGDLSLKTVSAGKFPAPAQWTPDTAKALLEQGSSPDQIVAQQNRANEIAKLNSPAQLAAMAAKGDQDARKALDILKQNNIAERQASNPNTNIVLTPQATQMLATNYQQSGQAPTFARGQAGQAQANVYNTAAKTNPTVNIAANKANYKADAGSLATLQKQRDAVGAFEQTASKNLDLFVNAAGKIPDSGSPWVNAPLRMLDEKLVGSENMAAVNVARQVANNEIAKVTSNPSLAGALSDSARHEVEAYNPQNATFKQTLAVAKILRQDMANRRLSLDQGIQQIKGRLSSSPGTQPAKSLDQIFGSK